MAKPEQDVVSFDQVIVVGGGLGGMAAANTVLEHGGRVLVLDKMPFCGGNSTKATSGINAAGSRTQIAHGIEDTYEIMMEDTLKGGAYNEEMVKILCQHSKADVEWLMDTFNLDLSLVARLGGHSRPRTHRGKDRFPGMTITYALLQMIEKIAERTDKARIITKANVFKLLRNKGRLIGVAYEKEGQVYQELGPVVLTTGGFGCDFGPTSLLQRYRPDLLSLPTVGGPHCTGDGMKMGEAIGANLIDMDCVQLHPTGLINPEDPDTKTKFLGAEALRGVGGLLLDADGKRFCNELGRRDYVSGEMQKNKSPFRLVLNENAAKEIEWHCKHYSGRGVMKAYSSGEELAKAMGIKVEVLEGTFEEYYQAFKKNEKDPEGGPWPGYPSGQSWDEPSGRTGAGKKFFQNVISGAQVRQQAFHVALVTPVIHYCMGGLQINRNAQVLDKDGHEIPGLFAAGETTGGVHGYNRLGGNSLLDCVVFGRTAGLAAVKHYLGDKTRSTSLQKLAGLEGSEQAEAHEEKEEAAPSSRPPEAVSTAMRLSVVEAPQKSEEASKGKKVFSEEEVAQHNNKDNCWVVLHDKVYDLTTFLPDHPGGPMSILTFAGKDATTEFDMIHPPGVIEKYAPNALIGDFAGKAAPPPSGGLAQPLLGRAARWVPREHEPTWLIATGYMALGFMRELVYTIFPHKDIVITNNRIGLTRSAMLLSLFILVHSVTNLLLLLGPDEFNGQGYFYRRLWWTGLGLNATILEEYLLLGALLHIYIGCKRTMDISISFPIQSGKLNLMISGTVLLLFLLVHLSQFRFGDADTYMLCPPRGMLNWFHGGRLFSDDRANCERVEAKDLYGLAFNVFSSLGWTLFYVACVAVLVLHLWLGWQKVVFSPEMEIPTIHQNKAVQLGKIASVVIGLIFISVPVYCHTNPEALGQ